MKTIFSCKTENNIMSVEIGLWNNIPQGQWCSIENSPYKNINYSTKPRVTKTGATWLNICVEPTRIYIEQKRKSFKGQEFKNELHAFSFAYSQAKTKYLYIPFEASGSSAQHRKQSTIAHIAKMAKKDVTDLLEILERHLTKEHSVYIEIETRFKRVAAYKTEIAQNAASKTAQTRAKTKNGGNPKVWTLKDIVCPRRPMTFKSGTVVTKFYYTTRATDVNGRATFFTHVDENGHGISGAYKARKKDLLKICPNAIELLTYKTMHEKIALLAEQKIIEERRTQEESVDS
jgi:hypothetical protein